MKKVTYSCDICRDPVSVDSLRGCNFSGMKKFKLDTPGSTDGVHICMGCLSQLQVQTQDIFTGSLEDDMEAAYWLFDHYKQGQAPMSDRDAFKRVLRNWTAGDRESTRSRQPQPVGEKP